MKMTKLSDKMFCLAKSGPENSNWKLIKFLIPRRNTQLNNPKYPMDM